MTALTQPRTLDLVTRRQSLRETHDELAGLAGLADTSGPVIATVVDLADSADLQPVLDLAAAAQSPVVLLSVLGVDRPTTAFAATVAEREAQVRAAVPGAIVLRTAPIVDDLTVYAPAVGGDQPVLHASGDAAVPWVGAGDVLRVAVAAALRAPAGSGAPGPTLAVTGERPVSLRQLLSHVGVRAVSPVSADTLRAALCAAGHDVALVEHVVAHQEWSGQTLAISPTVRAALGEPAQDPLDRLAELFARAT